MAPHFVPTLSQSCSRISLVFSSISSLGWRFQHNRRHIGVLAQQRTLTGDSMIQWHEIEQQRQLEESMKSLIQVERKMDQKQSSEQISKLTLSINRLMDSMEGGQKQEKEKE